MYIISNLDETKFITLDAFGKFTWTTNKTNANRYELNKANNIINNCLAKPTSDYKVVKYIELLKENARTAVDSIKEITNNNIEECDWDKELDFDVVKTAINYSSMVADLENEKILLNNKLIILSRAMVDLYHYKEFNPRLSAVTICKLHKFEVGVLAKRRECKNRLFYVDKLLDELNGRDVSGAILRFIENHDKYRVRIMKRLFDSGKIDEFDEWYDEILKEKGNESKTTCSTTE